MSFLTEVEDYVGSFADTTALDTWLSTGARIYIDLVRSSLELYATDKTDAGSGIDITGGRVIGAHKSSYKAKKVDSKNASLYKSATSIYLAVTTDPVWYEEKTKGYVLPSGGTIKWVEYPSVDNSTSSVANFPPEGYPVFVLYAAIQAQISNITTLIKTTLGGVSYSAPTNVTPPAAPSFTWTDATGTTVDLSTVSINKTLTFTPPAFGGSYANAETALGNEDIELASGHLNKISAQLQEYNVDLQRQVSEFNKESKQYDNELQEAITQAQLDAQRAGEQAKLTQDLKLQNAINNYKQDVEEYQSKLGKYQSDIQDYAAQVNEEIQRMSSVINQYNSMSQSYFGLLEQLRKEYQLLLERI